MLQLSDEYKDLKASKSRSRRPAAGTPSVESEVASGRLKSLLDEGRGSIATQ